MSTQGALARASFRRGEYQQSYSSLEPGREAMGDYPKPSSTPAAGTGALAQAALAAEAARHSHERSSSGNGGDGNGNGNGGDGGRRTGTQEPPPTVATPTRSPRRSIAALLDHHGKPVARSAQHRGGSSAGGGSPFLDADASRSSGALTPSRRSSTRGGRSATSRSSLPGTP